MTVPALPDTHPARRFASLHEQLEAAAAEADRLAEAGDLAALASGLDQIRAFRRAVSDLERHIEGHVADVMPQDHVNLDDEFTLERHRGRTRKQWQSADLLRHLVGDQLVDARTGENVFDLLVSVLPLTGSLGWRVGALRKAGVDPSDWCDEEPARTTVTVRGKSDL